MGFQDCCRERTGWNLTSLSLSGGGS
jgi:hypothetical protein